jgi:hypothetical protein
MMIGVDTDSQELQFYVVTKCQSVCGKSPIFHLLGKPFMGDSAKRKGYKKKTAWQKDETGSISRNLWLARCLIREDIDRHTNSILKSCGSSHEA